MIVPDDLTQLPEGTAVVISAVEVEFDIEGRPIDPAFLIGDLAIDTGIPDLGRNIDRDVLRPAPHLFPGRDASSTA